MSQFSPNDNAIDPNITSGIELANVINRLTGSQLTLHSGDARPAYAQLGTWWLDTSRVNTDFRIYLFDGSVDHWVYTLNIQLGTIEFKLGGAGGGGTTVSPSAPTSPATGDLWYSTTTYVMSLWDGTKWVAVSGSRWANITDPVATAENASSNILQAGVTSDFNLPVGPVSGYWVEIADQGATWGTQTLTVSGNGKNINGAATQALTSPGGYVLYVYTGTEWRSYASGGSGGAAGDFLPLAGGSMDADAKITLPGTVDASGEVIFSSPTVYSAMIADSTGLHHNIGAAVASTQPAIRYDISGAVMFWGQPYTNSIQGSNGNHLVRRDFVEFNYAVTGHAHSEYPAKAGAANISGTWEWQDNVYARFGNSADAEIGYKSSTNELIIGHRTTTERTAWANNGTVTFADVVYQAGVDSTSAAAFMQRDWILVNSDKRLKKSIKQTARDSSEFFRQLQFKDWIWNAKAKSSGAAFGLIADDVELIRPDLVGQYEAEEKSPKSWLDDNNIKYFKQNGLLMETMKALQEVRLELDAVKSQLASRSHGNPHR